MNFGYVIGTLVFNRNIWRLLVQVCMGGIDQWGEGGARPRRDSLEIDKFLILKFLGPVFRLSATTAERWIVEKLEVDSDGERFVVVQWIV